MHRYERQPRGHARPSQPTWSHRAHYAPGLPVYSSNSVPIPIRHFPYTRIPFPSMFPVPRPLDTYVRMAPPAAPIPRPLRHKVSIPKKQVHFNLAHSSPLPPQRAPPRRPSHENLAGHHRPATPGPAPRKPAHHNLRHQPSRHNLRRQPSHRDLRPSQPPPSVSQPTIWIVTYAYTYAKTDSAKYRVLSTEVPPGTPHLYTIYAYNFTPPPGHICDSYSGVSPIVQDYVMRDTRARQAVSRAIDDILEFRRHEMRMHREGRRAVQKDVAISVCCLYGTHRSVSIAERIAQGLEDMRLEVRVKVRHHDRVRGPRDSR